MSLDHEVIALWFHYEEIAMHFNQIIIQYRLQLMGGAGLIGALSSYLIGGKVEVAERRHMLRAYVSTGLVVLILAAAVLDVFYYNELLLGAVDALLRFEQEHPELYMSTLISNRFPNGGTLPIFITYGLVLGPLTLFSIWSWIVFVNERIRTRA